ncbi:MAG: hypothetical protein RSE41_10030, partial [Clostridia bacterium]
SANNKKYWEDEDVYEFPLINVKYKGKFKILNKTVIDNKIWYLLENNLYALNTNEEPVYNIKLKIGDYLSYKDKAIFKITNIQESNNNTKICIESIFGYSEPTNGLYFNIHDNEISQKTINLAIGYDELNVVFIKAINDEYNLLSTDWSTSIPFYTNDLNLENNTISLEEYYYNYVSDFGKQLEGQVKEKYIPAYYGEIPNAPVLTYDDFRVVQINTQLNASLDTQTITNTQKQIVETKSQIDSLKTTISKEKQNLITGSNDESVKITIREKIKTYTNNLSVLTSEYSSLVKSLATLAYESNASEISPKYRIRGFFPMPILKYTNDLTNTKPQEVVQFEIAYRYLRLDNTGTALNTFKYVDPVSGEEVSAVYSDWNIMTTKHKEKVFNNSTNAFEWHNENISSGEEININQIDISIQKGEKVEFKVRSLSEAGWPANPLKSNWSNSVIMNFPSNLETSSQVSFILNQAKEEETQIQLQNTLGSIGVYVHLDDTIPNLSDTSNSIYYKHMAENIAYKEKYIDESTGNNLERTISIQSQIENMQKTIIDLTNKLNTLQKITEKTSN